MKTNMKINVEKSIIYRFDVSFGSNTYSFDELFKHFKYFKNGEWLRFGVEE